MGSSSERTSIKTEDNSTQREMEERSQQIEQATQGDSLEKPQELPSSPRSIHGLKWCIAVTAILSTILLFSLDNTIVADVQPAIIQDFGEVSELAWLGTAFALGSAATILPWSKAYGVFNVKWLYISHVVLFETGSALCGGAPNMHALIVGRAIAGVGASGMYVGCLSFLSILTDLAERPLYMGLVGLIWGVGVILGPIIGGAFVDSHATWRWAFYINLVVGGFFAPAYLFLLPSIALQPGITLSRRLREQVDWLGVVIFAAAISCFVMAITFGGSLYAWGSGNEISLWVMTAVLFIAFAATQILHPFVAEQHKLYPTAFLRNPTLLILQAQTFIAAGSLLVPTYYIPLFFQFTRGSSALGAGVHLLAFVAMVVVFSMLNGSLLAKLGYYMPWYFAGNALILIGSALMYTLHASSHTSRVYGYSTLLGAGSGLFLQASYSVVQALLPEADVPAGIGFLSIGQSLGIVISLAIASAVFQNRALAAVEPLVSSTVPASIVRQTITGTSSELFQQLSPTLRVAVAERIVEAMDKVYLLILALAALGFVLSLLLPKNKLC